jgi:hypothetical protein
LTEKEREKEKTGKPEELHKVESAEVQLTKKHLEEAVVDASSVANVRKGIVSGSSVQQFRSQIEQPAAQQNQQPQQTKPKERKENQK